MKKMAIVSVIGLFCFAACVQKSYQRVVVVSIDVSNEKDVKSVGLRGDGNPLSWDVDYPLKATVPGKLYKGTFTTKTGYLFTEIKATVNGNFELQNQDNRRITFDAKRDTTFVDLVFNKR